MSKKIIVIDDSETVRQQLREAVVRAGYQVVEAADGLEGLDVIRAHEDAVLALCDVSMPRMNGLEFLQHLRADPDLHDEVVFVLTTSDSETDRERAYHANVAGYMVKSMVGPQFSKLAQLVQCYRTTMLFP